MRSQLFAPIVAIAFALGATAHAHPSTGPEQAPKPATGSTGSTGSAAKPATGPAATGTAKPQTPPTGNTAPKPAPAAPPAPAPSQPAKPAPAPTTPPPPAPAPAPSNPSAGSAAQPQAPQPLPPVSSDAYSYQTEGRRDPFLNLIGGGGNEKAIVSNVKIGPAGMSVAEIQVRGVMQSRAGILAMIMGPDNKTYIVHQGDKLLDGTIRQITPQGLVVLQEVNDPLSLVKQREVRKLLRSLEDAK